MDIPEFSLVIFPSEEVSRIVASFKKSLRSKIGRFGSDNAKAHITVINFDTHKADLDLWIRAINAFCKDAIPQAVLFNSFKSFHPSVFFAAPAQSSQIYLNQLIRDFHTFMTPSADRKNIKAHMTIARKLDAERLDMASELFKDVALQLSFICDAMHLRKFNPKTQQYSDVINKFEFKGTQPLTLF